jgi:hypothetical protein
MRQSTLLSHLHEEYANDHYANTLPQIVYLNSVVMPDEDSSGSEAESDATNEENDTAADEND